MAYDLLADRSSKNVEKVHVKDLKRYHPPIDFVKAVVSRIHYHPLTMSADFQARWARIYWQVAEVTPAFGRNWARSSPGGDPNNADRCGAQVAEGGLGPDRPFLSSDISSSDSMGLTDSGLRQPNKSCHPGRSDDARRRCANAPLNVGDAF